MNIFEINTTAFSEENFYLQTDLTQEQITEVITPIVLNERNGGDEYDNTELEKALCLAYPNNVIEIYYEFDTITI